MLTEPTTEKLQAMRLAAMAATWRDQTGKPDIHKLAFDERVDHVEIRLAQEVLCLIDQYGIEAPGAGCREENVQG